MSFASTSREQVENAQAAVSPSSSTHVVTMELFENYMKMTKFHTDDLQDIMESIHMGFDSCSCSDNVGLECNEYHDVNSEDERILKLLEGDSDLSDSLSEISSTSLKTKPSRKKKRIERWRSQGSVNMKINVQASDDPGSNAGGKNEELPSNEQHNSGGAITSNTADNGKRENDEYIASKSNELENSKPDKLPHNSSDTKEQHDDEPAEEAEAVETQQSRPSSEQQRDDIHSVMDEEHKLGRNMRAVARGYRRRLRS